ncbi:MarR family transcriptional regulator [Nonomuraea sp. FMUSA5-5]|uniref:MarR family transcriptional regulator n=1 Tax=Nonomuraea composti TaxID=2720023 RepID=A0ABX1AY64_9ACTN|nr:MarR family transcriptional regulator [Nonomuraea sp. FMUSA5-5]NJP90548.1 MarR family transcriptional regulator [Nonomuraea sp. FMUSA5-5]
MKYVHDEDDGGRLYDPRVRAAMREFTGDDDTLTFEAAAAVRSAQQGVERMRAHGSEGRGLSSGAMDLLLRLSSAAEAGASIGELAQAAGVSPRNATGLVDTLERDGLARRQPDPDDRRAVRAVITGAGRAWIEAFRQPSRMAMKAIFHGFTDDELATLRHLCLRLAANQERLAEHLGGQVSGR